MKLTGAEIANSGGSKFTQDVTCPWCLTASRLDLGPQHVHGDLTLHCHKCAKFSTHKTADRWFDQHQERMEELKDLWKKIPSNAYLTIRQNTKGTPYVYTLYMGTGRPEEFKGRDAVEHILTDEFGLSWKQTNGLIMTAALTPGMKVYLQRHTRLVMAAEQREIMKRTGATPQPIKTGTQVRVNGQDGIFLRYSANDGFAVVALPTPGLSGFGDAEVPVMELEVLDAGGPEVAEDFQMDKEMDEDGLAGIEEHEPNEGDPLDVALTHIEDAEQIIEDLVLEEGSEAHEEEDEHEEHESPFGDAAEDEHEEHEEKGEEGDEGEEKPPFAARRHIALAPGVNRPGGDPAISQKLQTLQGIINDPNTDPQTLQQAQQQWTQLKRQVPAHRTLSASDLEAGKDRHTRNEDGSHASECKWCDSVERHDKPNKEEKKAFFNYKTKDDLKVMERPDHKTKGPKLTDTKLKGDSWVPRNKGDNPLPNSNDENLRKVKANKDAQRRVHTHYAHSKDLRRAINVNRDTLSIEDIRDICAFYANTGKIAHTEADELAYWFIGDKPRLLCAADKQKCPDCGQVPNKHGECSCEESWGSRGRGRDPDREDFHSDGSRKVTAECTCEGAYDRYCPEHGARDLRRRSSKDTRYKCNSCDKEFSTARKDVKCPYCDGSAKKARVLCATDEAGVVEVPDNHPESGVTSGSGGDCPDPKWQKGDSANSVSGPDKVKQHGVGNSPEESGKVKEPDLGVPKGASMRRRADEEDGERHECSQCGGPLTPLGSLGKRKHYRCRNCGMDSSKEGMRRRADGICQKCGTPLNQAGQCPTCQPGAEQQQDQQSNMSPTTARRNRLAARHADGCGCGFCASMRDNMSKKKPKEAKNTQKTKVCLQHGMRHPTDEECPMCEKKQKAALSASDLMTRIAHDEVGIFMPAMHKGNRVLVIAVDNTGLRATVQDGDNNQWQVDFADLEPVKTGPYSGMPKKPDPGAR